MSTTFHYDVGVVFDNTGRPIPNARPLFRLATLDGPGAAAPVVDTDGDAAEIVTSEYGAFSRFNYVSADGVVGAWGYLDVNGVIQPVASIEVLNGLPAAQQAALAAQKAQAAAEAALAAIGAGGAGGGGSGGTPGNNTVGSDQVIDGSLIGADIANKTITMADLADDVTSAIAAGGAGAGVDATTLSTLPANTSTTKPWSAQNTQAQILGLLNDQSSTATNRTWSISRIVAYIAGLSSAPVTTDPTSTSTTAVMAAKTVGDAILAALQKQKLDVTLAPYNVGEAKTAAANGAALQQATIDAGGRALTMPAGLEVPVSGCVIADQDVYWDFEGSWLLQPAGADPLLKVERTPGTPMLAGPTSLVWWGPNQPSGVTISGLLQKIPMTGLNRFAGSRNYHISSADRMPWAWSAQNLTNADGSSNYAAKTDGLATQAEPFPLLGIGLMVKGITSAGGPLEQMMVQGQQSGATGLVASSLLGNANSATSTPAGTTTAQAHVTFTKITGSDFIDGENLVRITGGSPTGSTVAPVGATVGQVDGVGFLLTSDIFVLQYGRTTAAQAAVGTAAPVRTDNTVQVREIPVEPVCVIRAGFDVVGNREDPDAYVAAASRTDLVQLRGVYAPQITYRVRNAWTRAMCVWSSYMGRFDGYVDQMPNHARLDQSAFAYGLELKSGSKGNSIRLQGHSVRHLFTTNPNERTFSMTNALSGGKYPVWDYGTPIRNTIHDSVVECAYAPGLDTHPGDYFTTFINSRIYGGGSGGRYNTDNNAGASTRGFGTHFINIDIHNSSAGINLGGVEHDAGLPHRIVIQDCHIHGVLSNAVFAYDAMVPGQVWVEIEGGSFSGRTSWVDENGLTQQASARYYQSLIATGDGVGCVIRGNAQFRKFAGTWLNSRGRQGPVIFSAEVDYTECPTSATGLRVDSGTGVVSTVEVHRLTVRGNPSVILRNQSGDNVWLVGDIVWLGTGVKPDLYLTSAGSPTYTKVGYFEGVVPLTQQGNANVTNLHPRKTGPAHEFGVDLTANRTVTLSTSNLINGDSIEIVRTAGGAFTLTVTTLGVALAQGQSVRARWNGSSWVVLAGSGGSGGGSGSAGATGVGYASRSRTGQLALPRGVTAATATAMPATSGRTTFYPQELVAGTVYDAGVLSVTGTAMAGGAGVTMKVGVYADDGSGAWPLTAAPLVTLDASASLTATGIKQLTFAAPWTVPADGVYWIAVFYSYTTAPTTSPTLQCIGGAAFSLSMAVSAFPNKPKAYARTGDTDLPAAASATADLTGITSNDAVLVGLRRSA